MPTPPIRSAPAGRGFSWIGEGFSQLRDAPIPWILASLAFVAASIALGLLPILGGLALQLLLPPAMAGFVFASARQARGADPELPDFLRGFGERLPSLLILALAQIAILLGLAALGALAAILLFGAGFVSAAAGADLNPESLGTGLLLLLAFVLGILAVSIPVTMAFWFSAPLVAFAGLSPPQALAASFSACLRNLLPMIAYSIGAFGLSLLVSATFGLAALFVIPVLLASFSRSYAEIFGEPR